MAKARLVCSDCGNELSPNDRYCPHCGARIEGKEHRAQTENHSDAVTCSVCGQVSTHQAAYCEACGAKLPGRTFAATPREHVTAPPSPKPRISSATTRPSARLQPWHFVAAVAVVGLLAWFVYIEVRRESGSSKAESISSEQSSHQPPKEILDAIERLERQVRDNPTDHGAKLMLANALHDASMHDPRMLPRAIEAYREYLTHMPADPNARVDLGICYFELAKVDTAQSGSLFTMAIREMESVMKANPKHQAGAFNLGIVYLYAGNMKESNKWFQKAIEVNPESDLGRRAKTILDQHTQAER